MRELLTSPTMLLPAIVVALAVLHMLAQRLRRQRRERREHGWRLIHELKAYSAWVESLDGEPFTSAEPDELTSAQALRNARTIAQAQFAPLGQMMLRLLQADSDLMRHLWEQKLARLVDPGAWVPCRRDPVYRALRESQEDLIDAIIARCRVLIGDARPSWRSTAADPEFFASMSTTTRPGQ